MTTNVDTCIYCGQPVEGKAEYYKDHALWSVVDTAYEALPDESLTTLESGECVHVTARAHSACGSKEDFTRRALDAVVRQALEARNKRRSSSHDH